jgi:hypothetical protein
MVSSLASIYDLPRLMTVRSIRQDAAAKTQITSYKNISHYSTEIRTGAVFIFERRPAFSCLYVAAN